MVENSDKCTKVFHDVTKENKFNERISRLFDYNGYLLIYESDIQIETVRFYTGLVAPKGIIDIDSSVVKSAPIISYHDSLSLITPVTTDEINSTLFGMDESRDPSLDGFNAVLFQKSWLIIKHDRCIAI